MQRAAQVVLADLGFIECPAMVLVLADVHPMLPG